MLKVYNSRAVFSVLSQRGKTFKPELVDTIEQSIEYKTHEAIELKKSEQAFEESFKKDKISKEAE